jgi:hypothetical protein
VLGIIFTHKTDLGFYPYLFYLCLSLNYTKMKYILTLTLIIITILSFPISLSAQNGDLFNRIESLTLTAYYDTTNSGTSLEVNTHEYKELSTELSDTSNITSIRVILGTTADASDIQLNTYNFSGEHISSQLWLSRRVNTLQLGLGDLVNKEQCFIRIEALDANGLIVGSYSGILY